MGLNYGYKYTISSTIRENKGNNYIPKPEKKIVCQYDSKGNYITKFESCIQASEELNIDKRLVSSVCIRNKYKNLDELIKAKGFYLKYEKDLNNIFNHF